MLKKILTKLGRLVALYFIITGVIASVVVLALAIDLSLPTFRAIGWHIRHGNKISFEGHTFHLPLLWNCDPNHYKEIDISEDHSTFGGLSSIDIASKGTILDSATAYQQQARMIANFNRLSKSPDTMYAETIHGKRLEFVCARADMGPLGETLFCRAANTDISVIVTASPKYRAETRAILETSE